MRRWIGVWLVGMLALVAMPQAQTAPKIAWSHAGTNVTHFQLQIASNWIVEMGLPTPTGGSYEYTLPALPSGAYDVAVKACYGATCETSATLKVSKGVVGGATNNNFYWVDDDGAAVSWAACKSDAPLSGTDACTLAQANTNARAGDTVWLRGGTYSYTKVIYPTASGASASSRITYAAYPGETPVLEGGWNAPATVGVTLAQDYILVRGITVKNHNTSFNLSGDYNEISYCHIYADATYTGFAGAVIPIATSYLQQIDHNWIHHNTIHGFGENDGEGSDLIRVGHSTNNNSDHNTLNNNLLYHAGHATGEDYGKYNAWINNITHNEGWKPDGLTLQVVYGAATSGSSGSLVDTSKNFVTAGVSVGDLVHTTGVASSEAYAVGEVTAISTTTNTNDTLTFVRESYWLPVFAPGTGYAIGLAGQTNVPDAPGDLPGNGKYGHRNFSLSNDSGTDTAKYVLMEGNRIGWGSINYANRGAEGLSLGSPGNIIRYNMFFGQDASGIGIKSYSGASYYGANNRIYSNTFYKNGQAAVSANPDFLCTGVSDIYGYTNYYKNNLFFQNGTTKCATRGDLSASAGVFANNLCTTTVVGTACTATADPGFVAPTMTDPTSLTLPNLSLSSGADAIGKGGALTTVHSDDTGSGTTLVVTDALYFQDGTLGSSLSQGKVVWPDWIAVGTVGNVAQISSIDYATNTITLASGISRSDGDSVWLYKRADGVVVLSGAAPDAGASEYGSGSPTAPTGLVVR